MEWEAIEKLALAVLTHWIRSAEPMTGDMWILWCQVLGVDPVEFAQLAEERRAT